MAIKQYMGRPGDGMRYEPIPVGEILTRYFERGPIAKAITVHRDRQQLRLPLNGAKR